MRRNYSKVIQEMREQHGLNLVAIGQRIGIDPRTVGKWQQGKHQPSKKSKDKLNRLYREVKNNMTTQVSIFEDDTTGQKIMQVVTTTTFHGQPLDIYGSEQEPLFRAGEVAKLIDYSNTSLSKFLEMVDDDEKDKKNVLTPGGVQKVWFLTEQGLYEVLFQSRKPKAKEFKKWVKQVIKEIRLHGYYIQGELIEAPAPQPQALANISDLTYIRNKVAEIQEMDTLEDILAGLERTTQLVQLIKG